MRDRWMNLSLREKQIVSLGGLSLALLLAYMIIWAPFTNKISAMRNQIQQDRELLSWMQQADQRMQALTKKPHTTTIVVSVLSTVQNQLKNSSLAAHVTQLRQGENNSAQLAMQKVDFDQLITWLTKLWHEDNLIVGQITVTPGDAPGVVSAQIMLRSG